MFRRVAIIGGGAASAILLSELLDRRLPQPLHLDWYTGGDTSGRGVAYSTRSPRHLLNVRAASMGLFADASHSFLDFVQRREPGISGNDFLPRQLYGDYLEHEVAMTLERGKRHGHDVNVIPFAVDALVPESGAVTVIRGEEGQRMDAAVLALGALPAQPLDGVDAAALQSGRYVVDPWPMMLREFPQPPPRNVIVIGSGLTAADVLVELSARWPLAHFITVSSHGLMPEVHGKSASAPANGSETLVEAMHEAPDVRFWLRLLRESIVQEKDWRSLIDSLRPHTPQLWRALSITQRARFLRHALWLWQRARHRMPPLLAETLTSLELDGRLQHRRGRLRSVGIRDEQLQLHFAAAGQSLVLQADLVVQATGVATDVRRTTHPLIGQLHTNAHVQADPLGLGLQADEDGRLRHGDQHWPHLFAIGSLLRGAAWESSAIPEIRQQARAIAARLLST